MKYSCLSSDSIRLMAEAAGVTEPTLDVASTISEEVTLRLRLIIARAIKFTRHANRTKLTCADINKALLWSGCQPVFGHECNSSQRLRYSYSTEAKVFRYEDTEVDLIERYRDHSNSESLLLDGIFNEAIPTVTIINQVDNTHLMRKTKDQINHDRYNHCRSP